jgi:hypothetical protein
MKCKNCKIKEEKKQSECEDCGKYIERAYIGDYIGHNGGYGSDTGYIY